MPGIGSRKRFAQGSRRWSARRASRLANPTYHDPRHGDARGEPSARRPVHLCGRRAGGNLYRGDTMPRPLPTSPAARQSIADEAATAERVVAACLMNVRAMETVGRQARNPVFRGARTGAPRGGIRQTRGDLAGAAPSLVHCGPCLTLPDPSLSPAEYLRRSTAS